MPVEDHPKYAEWKAALEHLVDAKRAQREGTATPQDVEIAKDAYYKIADEV